MSDLSEPVSVLVVAVQDINRALEAQIFYAAITVALTIPSICASLEKERAWSTGVDYENWCDRYICKRLGVPPSALNQARNGVVHMGRGGDFPKPQKLSYGPSLSRDELAPAVDRVLFILPIDGNVGPHCNQLDNAMQFDAKLFCTDMIDSLSDWCKDEKDNPLVLENAKKLMHYYPNGLIHYVDGHPVIA